MEVFVVRLWPDDRPLRGRVEHVASGEATTFVGPEHLLSFLAERGRGGGGEADGFAAPDASVPQG